MKMSKHAFKGLVKRCIAEVILEPTQDSEKFPHEKWEDTFGNKMAGEYIAEDGDVIITNPKKVKVKVKSGEKVEEDLGTMGTMSEAGVQKVDRISPGERNKIGKAFAQLGLDGNGRFESVEAGLAAVTKVLGSLGFNLDMVSKDMIMGDKGSRNFIYRRVNAPGQDIFTEQPELKNSRLVFSWERMDGPSFQYPDAPHKFEILAYAS